MVGGGLAWAVPNDRWIGWAFVAIGVLIMLWGVRINDRHLWQWRPFSRTRASMKHIADERRKVDSRARHEREREIAAVNRLTGNQIGRSIGKTIADAEDEAEARRLGRIERLKRGEHD